MSHLLSLTSSTLGTALLPRASSTFADTHDGLYLFIFWLCVVFFVGLMGAMCYFVFKYRRRPGVAQQRSPSHNTPLELLWSIGPLLILIVIFFWGFDGYLKLAIAPANAEEVNVTGRMWAWSLEYDNGAVSTETWKRENENGELVDVVLGEGTTIPVYPIPAGRPIKLIMTSEDVIHSFWIPDFRVKFDVFPYRYTTLWFESTELEADDPVVPAVIGEDGQVVSESYQYRDHYVFCAEYCGDQHSEMAAILRVLPPAEYAKWKQNNVIDTNLAPKDLGALLYITKACNSCHGVEPGAAGTGPTWHGIYGDTSHPVLVNGALQTVTVDENYLRESILVPGAKLVEGYPNQMQSYQGQLSEKELFGLIAYIKSLSEIGQAELEAEAAEAEAEAGAEEGAAESGG